MTLPCRFLSAACLLGFLAPLELFAQCSNAWWHTGGNKILDSNGQTVRIAGVNWYGFETTDHIAHGLWAQDYKSILNNVKNLGYNTIRVPFSNEMVESNPVPSNFTTSNGKNTDLQGLTSLAILDKIVAYAAQIGLRIILDNHRSEAGNSAEDNGLWYTSSYPQSKWIADWNTLASKYACNSTVVGYDLRNEPHNNATWGDGNAATDWQLAAQAAGNQILAVNPNALIFVEGIQQYQGDYDWWGGNLEGAGQHPVILTVPNRVVYSAHDYGPNLSGQNWFNGSTTYNSLVAVWTQKWAYLSLQNIAPVWVGEFGTTNNASDLQSTGNGSQGQWFQSMVQFLGQNSNISWTYWALNGEDNYGLLDNNYDAAPASATKQQMLASIQSVLPTGGTTAPDFSLSAAPSSQSMTAGGSVQYTISIAGQNNFTGTVGFSASGVPMNTTATFSPASVAGTGKTTLTLTSGSVTPAASYTIMIAAVSGALSHSTTVSLTVNSVPTSDFSISASPGSSTITAGSGAQFSITTTAKNNFNGSVALSVSGLPSGATASFAPQMVSGSGSASLTVVTSASTPAGTYALVVTGTSGSLNHSAPASLTVQSAQSGSGCLVTWQVYSDWGQGFVTGITVTNQGPAAINGWTLAWTFTGNQQITNLWNGTVTQSGQTVRVANASYNSTITAGGNQMLGFQASYSGVNQRPAAFTLNGQRCASN